MILAPINQRYATVEDIFVHFIAPIVLNVINSENDSYFLYTPYKNVCPTKALIEKGITMHYTPYSIHRALLKTLETLSTSIWNALNNYFYYTDDSTALALKLKDHKDNITFKEVNSDKNTYNKLSSLRLFILNAFNFVNANVISELQVFHNYAIVIKQPDFTIDESKYGTDASYTLSVGFKKLKEQSVRISQHIPDINKFTIGDFINIYLECVIKENFDVIYTVYKLKGYTIVDNSEPHISQSLCRLCDIILIGVFEVCPVLGYSDTTYEYDEYAAFNTSDELLTIFPSKPYIFKLISHYNSNHYSIPFQISDIQVSSISESGSVSYQTTLTDEAVDVMKNTPTDTGLLLDVTPNKKDEILIGKIESVTTITDKAHNVTFGQLNTDKFNLWINGNNGIHWSADKFLEAGTLNPTYNFDNNTLTLTPSHLYNLLYNPNKNSNNNTFTSTITLQGSSGLNLADEVSRAYNTNANSIQALKYLNTSLIIKNIGVGIIPYIDNNYIPSYCAARSNINPDYYSQYAACFTTKNTEVGKRSAIISLTLNDSLLSENILISLYGAPLKIRLTLEQCIPGSLVKEKPANPEGHTTKNVLVRYRFKLKPKDSSFKSEIANNKLLYLYTDNSTGRWYEDDPSSNIYDAYARINRNNNQFDYYIGLKSNNDEPVSTENFYNYYQNNYKTNGFRMPYNFFVYDIINSGGTYPEYVNYYVHDDGKVYPETTFAFLDDTKTIMQSMKNVELQFYIKCNYADFSKQEFYIYFNSYSQTVPEVLKSIQIAYQYETILIRDEIIEEIYIGTQSKIKEAIKNLTIDTKPITDKPVVKLEWEYDGKNGVIRNYQSGISAEYTNISINEKDDGTIEIKTTGNIANWVSNKNYDSFPIIPIQAWNRNDINLYVFSIADSSCLSPYKS